VNRLAFLFAFCFVFGALGAERTAAQAAPPVVAEAPVAPQARIPAQPPVAARPPGLIPPASSSQAANKPATPSRSVQPAASGKSANRTAQQAVQTKIVQIYRGDGYFDAALAEKLRPVFAKNSSEPAPSNNSSTPVDWLRTILAGRDSSQKNVNQKTVAETGRP
jgi:hypothetical protein